jgi:hypothetical protein
MQLAALRLLSYQVKQIENNDVALSVVCACSIVVFDNMSLLAATPSKLLLWQLFVVPSASSAAALALTPLTARRHGTIRRFTHSSSLDTH